MQRQRGAGESDEEDYNKVSVLRSRPSKEIHIQFVRILVRSYSYIPITVSYEPTNAILAHVHSVHILFLPQELHVPEQAGAEHEILSTGKHKQ